MTAKEFSDKTGIAQSSVSRMLKPLGSENSKNIGEKVARKIERTFKKPYGWMDTDNVVDMLAMQAQHRASQGVIQKPITLLNTGRIPLLNQGNTRMLDSYMDGTVTPTETYQYHDDKTTGLFAYIVPDDLMEPRIPRGCTAIIDIKTEPRHGKHVLIQDGERSHIRRLVVDGDLKYQETVSGRLPARPLTGTIIGVVKEIVINLDD
jgi:hypothetical protein